MTAAEIAQTYDRLASFWAGGEFDQANGLAAHRRALRFLPASTAAAPARAALEVGCGSSGLLDALVATGAKRLEFGEMTETEAETQTKADA